MRDSVEQSRFELEVDGQIVFANYRRHPDVLVITYVYAPPQLRGTGAADRLMEQVARKARADSVRVKALCGYAWAWLRRQPAHRDLLD
ncbi:GNAT family N-acetyltransferase [Methylobacterium nigriterrae]|uniref:GNAT family N-acetyltransferase n=1 Tax=Methylobacterium nigriterrae TaxID=3127512 RepID=UPI003013E5AF